MILRVFRAIVREGRQEEFERFFLGTALPLIRSQPGLVSVSVGLPHESSPREFCMLMTWRDQASVEAFAGPDWQRAVVHPDEAHLLEGSFVSHFRAAGP